MTALPPLPADFNKRLHLIRYCGDDFAAYKMLDELLTSYALVAIEQERELLREAADAIAGAIQEYGRNVCEHEETKRGGAIWTICCQCGAKWADDRGGFQPYKEPQRITQAAEVMGRICAALAVPVGAGDGDGVPVAPVVGPSGSDWQLVAWVDGAALRYLNDQKRGLDAYIVTSLNKSDWHGTRTALYVKRTPGVPVPSADERMRHDYPILQQFHTRHALGGVRAPSCLCCGRQTGPDRPVAVQHMELPAIVVCKPCKQAADGVIPTDGGKHDDR